MKKRSVLRPWAGHATFGTEKKQFPDRRDFANDQRKTFTGFESMCSPTCVASCLALVSIRIRLLLLIGKHLLAKDSAPWCWWRWWWWGGGIMIKIIQKQWWIIRWEGGGVQVRHFYLRIRFSSFWTWFSFLERRFTGWRWWVSGWGAGGVAGDAFLLFVSVGCRRRREKNEKRQKKSTDAASEKKTVVCFFRLLVLFETELFGR